LLPKYRLSSKTFRSANKDKLVMQPKLKINTPDDQYEQEADAMAERVMRMPSDATPRKQITGLIGASVQRKCAHWEEEDRKKLVMRKAKHGDKGLQASSSLLYSLQTNASSGSPLPQSTRNFMENAFSVNFSAVRVHTDSQASKMSR